MLIKSTDTPCIGVCSTIYGDTICRGCKRHYREVIDWNGYADTKKLAVLKRLEQLIAQVMQQVCDVFDWPLLEQQLKKYQVRYRPEWNGYCYVYALLANGAHKIQQLNHYGVVLKPPFGDKPLPALFNWIDAEIFANAEINSRTSPKHDE